MEVMKRFLLVLSIHVGLAAEIAFFFQADVFKQEIVNCAGMSHVFYTQYKYDANDAVVAINPNLFSTFIITEFMESLPC